MLESDVGIAIDKTLHYINTVMGPFVILES